VHLIKVAILNTVSFTTENYVLDNVEYRHEIDFFAE